MSPPPATLAAPTEPEGAVTASWRMRIVLSALMAFASISTDLYLPALPRVAAELHADPARVQLTIAAYLAGFSAGQLLWGPIGDRYGRRGPIAVGTLLFIAGAAGCAMSGSVEALLLWRVVQAIGACAGVVLARAMVRDLYARDRAAQMMSRLLIVMLIAPLAGPSIGGQILALAGWRAIFWTLAGVAALTLAALFTLPDTLPPARRQQQGLAHAFAGYGALLRHRALIGYALAIGFYYGGTFAYIAASPFAYITYYRVPSSQYGLLFGLGVAGIMIANTVNARAVLRLGADRLMRRGTLAAAAAGLGLALAGATGALGLAGLVIPMFVYTAVSGFIVANAVAGALARHPDRAGTASALVGAIQFGGGIVGAALVSAFADGTPRPMTFIIALAGLASAACARWFVPRTPQDRCVPQRAPAMLAYAADRPQRDPPDRG